ncbi:hypothetical protein Nepgr_024283 [Nepenthes gracilis]|uniref:Uncharacterized protein n=1 Tax=Nepenthes gracilis TaxID=150966 RepID=A0AAD3XZW9_NEPGR|nr:hypothetical protein Nepgr_024283 [Nepenthes gracilis]
MASRRKSPNILATKEPESSLEPEIQGLKRADHTSSLLHEFHLPHPWPGGEPERVAQASEAHTTEDVIPFASNSAFATRRVSSRVSSPSAKWRKGGGQRSSHTTSCIPFATQRKEVVRDHTSSPLNSSPSPLRVAAVGSRLTPEDVRIPSLASALMEVVRDHRKSPPEFLHPIGELFGFVERWCGRPISLVDCSRSPV